MIKMIVQSECRRKKKITELRIGLEIDLFFKDIASHCDVLSHAQSEL